MDSSTLAHPPLERVLTGRVVGGVCAGLARHFAVDPILVRLAFVAFAFAGGFAVLAYVVLWIVMPVSGDTATSVTTLRGDRNELLAMVLIGVGALWLAANLGVFTWVQWRYAWPIAVVALGVALLVRRTRP